MTDIMVDHGALHASGGVDGTRIEKCVLGVLLALENCADLCVERSGIAHAPRPSRATHLHANTTGNSKSVKRIFEVRVAELLKLG